jgi:prepilin-type N-terminal cleavage/methylation domain-containing protein
MKACFGGEERPPRPPSVARRAGLSAGFTLLEMIVAIVLTSLVALLAYSAAQVAIDTRTRMTAHLHDVESARAVRMLLTDALRNARGAQRPGDPGFNLQDNQLSFVASGGAAPLDPDYDWRITVTPAATGLQFVATPLGHAPATQVAFRIPDVTRWDVQVLDANAQWRSDWTTEKIIPRATAIAFWHNSVTAAMPIRLVLSP